MGDFIFDHSEADTIIFSVYAVLRELGYSGPVVIDSGDTDTYVAVVLIAQKFSGMLYIKRTKNIVSYRTLMNAEIANCIVQLHCMTGCDANSGFYGKGKQSVYNQVVKNPVARHHLSCCGDSLDIQE